MKEAKALLKAYFGYEDFRPGQEEMVTDILAGRDVLAVMPTGAGKSICYQLPALILPGVTIVISPLISLMVDQVRALNAAGIHAAYINSALTDAQIVRALSYAARGRYDLVYVAPERLSTPEFMTFAMTTDICLIAVDEAHCISQWGQDFRPGYKRIYDFVISLPKRPVVAAFTATATKRVQDDIAMSLHLQDPGLLVTGFDRPNLYFALVRPADKIAWLITDMAGHREETTIIYCSTRKKVEEVYEVLREEGLSVGRYHAGMEAEDRARSQEDFVTDRTRVMVATNAFGMGIDKPDVRRVIHFNMPQSMENYYQEAGRAGRDGEEAEALLLVDGQDYVIARYLLEHKDYPEGMTGAEILTAQDRDLDRLRFMERYTRTGKCLRSYILRYFGEKPRGECGKCSNCCRAEEEAGAAAGERRSIPEHRSHLTGIGWDDLTAVAADSDDFMHGDRKQKDHPGGGTGTAGSGAYHSRLQALDIRRVVAPEGDGFSDEDRELLRRLDDLRKEIAGENGVAPYMICNLRTLKEICRRRPGNRAQMLELPGMTETKYDNFGWRFFKLLSEAVD